MNVGMGPTAWHDVLSTCAQHARPTQASWSRVFSYITASMYSANWCVCPTRRRLSSESKATNGNLRDHEWSVYPKAKIFRVAHTENPHPTLSLGVKGEGSKTPRGSFPHPLPLFVRERVG